MGYSIDYDTGGIAKVHKGRKRGQRKWILPTLAVAGVVALVVFTDFKQLLWDIFLPGATESTEIAFSQMISDLKAGDSLRDAVNAFCMEILENAQP